MSHQGNDFWFPECARCGCGNLGIFIICTDCAKKISVRKADKLRKSFFDFIKTFYSVTGRGFYLDEYYDKNGKPVKQCCACKKLFDAQANNWASDKVVCLNCHDFPIENYYEHHKDPPLSFTLARATQIVRDNDKKVFKKGYIGEK